MTSLAHGHGQLHAYVTATEPAGQEKTAATDKWPPYLTERKDGYGDPVPVNVSRANPRGPVGTEEEAKAAGWVGPYFHGTSSRRAREIRQGGFRQPRMHNWQMSGPGDIEEVDAGNTHRTFFADKHEDALEFARAHHGDDATVVTAYLHPDHVETDSGGGFMPSTQVRDVAHAMAIRPVKRDSRTAADELDEHQHRALHRLAREPEEMIMGDRARRLFAEHNIHLHDEDPYEAGETEDRPGPDIGVPHLHQADEPLHTSQDYLSRAGLEHFIRHPYGGEVGDGIREEQPSTWEHEGAWWINGGHHRILADRMTHRRGMETSDRTVDEQRYRQGRPGLFGGKTAARALPCEDCGGTGQEHSPSGERSWECRNCGGSGTFHAADSWAKPTLPPEQAEALDDPDYSRHRKALDVAKNPAPGTHVWRGEIRHKDDIAHPTSVGMHWSVKPEQAILGNGKGSPEEQGHTKDHRHVLWQGVVEHPEEQAIPRSHPIWRGRHQSMDSEAEVRFRPGARVHLNGAYVWDAEGQAQGTPIPRNPDRTPEGWSFHPLDHHVTIEHKRSRDDDLMAYRQAFPDLFAGKTASYADYVRSAWEGRAEQYPDKADFFHQRAEQDYQREQRPGYHPGEPIPDEPRAGWVRTEKLAQHMEHAGDQHGASRTVVDAIKDDLHSGRGFTTPLRFYLDEHTRKATIGEGNHRLQAALEAGHEHVPVTVRPMHEYFGDPPKDARRVQFETKPFPAKDRFDESIDYHPADVLPPHWLHSGGKTATAWLPSKRLFGPTYGLDHRLFDGEHLKPDVRSYVLGTLDGFWRPMYGQDWRSWARVYLSGSEASRWTSPTLEGNNDFDVLIGVDYARLRAAVPSFAGKSAEEITSELNNQLRLGLDPRTDPAWITVDGEQTGPWSNTWYVNKAPTWDIRDIRPYAAYDITRDEWIVTPPDLPDWDISRFPEGEGLTQEITGVLDMARGILQMPEPYRTQQGNQFWHYIHDTRSRAFTSQGEGWYDPSNVLEKALDQAGLLQPLWALMDRARQDPATLNAPADWSNDPRTP